MPSDAIGSAVLTAFLHFVLFSMFSGRFHQDVQKWHEALSLEAPALVVTNSPLFFPNCFLKHTNRIKQILFLERCWQTAKSFQWSLR